MTVPRPLYLASSLQELQTNAKIEDLAKFKVYQLCESAEKVMKEAIMKQYLGDEEQAFILYLRYVEMNKIVCVHPVFMKNKKYFTSMYDSYDNQKNIDAAEEALESLRESLESRYKDKYQEDASNEIARLTEILTNPENEIIQDGHRQHLNLEFAEKSIRETERKMLLLQAAVRKTSKYMELVDRGLSVHEALKKAKVVLELVNQGLGNYNSSLGAVLEVFNNVKNEKDKELLTFDGQKADGLSESEDESIVFTSSKPAKEEIVNVVDDETEKTDEKIVDPKHTVEVYYPTGCTRGGGLGSSPQIEKPTESKIVRTIELMKKIFNFDNLRIIDLLNCRLVSRYLFQI